MPEQPHKFSKLAEELIGDLRGMPPDVPKRSKQRATQPVSAVLEQLLQKYQIGCSSPEQTIRDHWRKIVDPSGGTANSSYSHPLRIDRNRLIVLTSHSVVRNELFLHREEIVERIRQLPGCGAVKTLFLRSG